MPYYRARLLEELGQRQRKNPAYSLRAFAKALGLQPPTLSAVLAGKRGIAKRGAPQLATKLELRPIERERFLKSIYGGESGDGQGKSGYLLNEEEHYKILSEWEHYAVLTLMQVRGFRSDPRWMARRLGITLFRTRDVLARLVSTGLVRLGPKGYERTTEDLTTNEDVMSSALRKAHDEELRIAAAKQASVPVHLRDYSSVSVVASPSRISDAKKLIREFRKRFADLVETEGGTEVYQLCLQLFPLTEIKGDSK